MTDTLSTAFGSGARTPATGGRRADRVAVLGSGLLGATIARMLASTYDVDAIPAPPAGEGCAALVMAADAPGSQLYATARRYAARHRMPWLPVYVEPGWVILGPAILPDRPGCPTCAQRRRRGNRANAQGREELWQVYGTELAGRVSALLTPLTAAMTAALVADEITRLLRVPSSAHTREAMLRLSLATAATHRHPLLPDPTCPDCARLPADTPHTAAITLRPIPKPAPGTYRIRELVPLLPALQRQYVDPLTGLIQSLGTGERGGFPFAVARIQPATANGNTGHGYGYGRTTDSTSARVTALTEALERLSGGRPRGRRTVVRAAFTDIADQALDPVSLGLYPAEHYELPGFGFRRYDPTQQRDWVWGYSFGRGTPILVPQAYAYYGPNEEAFVYECSNGCALGSCLEEAILYGLLEVAERDAFLMTWYARLPAPRVDLDATDDRQIPLLAQRIHRALSYQVLAFETTLEQGIPCYWVMALDQRPAPGRLHALCTAGAHLDPERALRSALSELAPMVAGEQTRYDPQQATRMLADPDQVQAMDDHATLYGHPDASARLDFLPLTGPARPPGTSPAAQPWPAHDDLADDLTTAIGRYLACGLDVIVVDQTSSEHAWGSFRCVKVFVPGTLSMTFGHRYRRIDGLPRLYSVPRLLGYRDRNLRPEEVNPHPHPFP
jgi:ribosomal protein S12 methylthiotransferase accessory factor